MTQEFKNFKPKTNTIFRGDNLEIMKAMPDNFVSMVYIDPPFFTQRDYENMWGDKESVFDYSDHVDGFEDTSDYFERHIKSDAKGLQAYLEWLRARIIEIHRVLKKDGTFFLHLDYHAVHYAKIICDEIFGYDNFINEIIWKRTVGGGNTTKKRFGTTTDTILFYSKSKKWTFNQQFKEYDKNYVNKKYTHEKDGRKYRLDNLTAPKYTAKNVYKYKGYEPPKNGWRWTAKKMKEMDKLGYVHFPKSKSMRLQQIRYLDEQKGTPVDNIWIDIPPVNSQAKEDTGWPTQKPVALLERILKSVTNEGDVVLDCFAGCGSTMHAAHNLKRKWIGLDISSTAVKVNKKRLEDIGAKVSVIDENDLAVKLEKKSKQVVKGSKEKAA